MQARLLGFLALALFLGLGSSVGRTETIVFAQLPTNPQTNGYTAWESESASGNLLGRTYDNFVVALTTEIDAVTWEGIYVNQASASGNPASPNTTSFSISLWSDAGGQPGIMLAQATVPYGSCHATRVGTVDYPLAAGVLVSAPRYSYTAKLHPKLAVKAGEKYWLSILSDSTAEQPVWGWYSGLGGNKKCVLDFDETRSTKEFDRAFALESSVVPKVTLSVTTAVAQLSPEKVGVFKVKLSDPQTTATAIHYTLAGSAVNGEDYNLLTEVVKVSAFTTGATVRIVPKGTLEGDASKTVKLTLDKDKAYTISGAGSETVKIDK